MKAVGIVAEYNPLHNGHVYHIGQAKKIAGADAVVVAMSGDFVQRGEPAILDKWTRTELALRAGADVVLEIPVISCLGNAGQYAEGAVRLLESLGKISHIVFGSESGDTALLQRVADVLVKHSDEINEEIRILTGSGMSYPAAREKAYLSVRKRFSDADPDLSDLFLEKELACLKNPNDILAIEYIKAASHAEPLVIKRTGAGYSSPVIPGEKYQSAGAIRDLILQGGGFGSYVPEYTADAIRTGHVTGNNCDRWFDLLRYAVMSTDADAIDECPSGGEGLGNLIRSAVVDASSRDDLITRVKSRRYTYTRLSRLCLQILLGITRNNGSADYIRVLGLSSTGRKLLAEIRDEESSSVPVITNINKEAHALSEESSSILKMDIHAADIYNLATGRDVSAFSDHRMRPVLISDEINCP